MTEGPYFVDEMLNRSDIRVEPSDGSTGDGQLYLTIYVMNVTAVCAPLEGAQVDIWHCDALGVYSDVQDASQTVGQKWLRGLPDQRRDGEGRFHDHLSRLVFGARRPHSLQDLYRVRSGRWGYEFTSQFFFDDALSDEVFREALYASKGARNTLNSNDGIYSNGGDQMLLQPVKQDDGSYAATFYIGLDFERCCVGWRIRPASMGGAIRIASAAADPAAILLARRRRDNRRSHKCAGAFK
ncbi:MAG: twin-arginine translocation pathway signal protein [Anaerolineae bacterium]